MAGLEDKALIKKMCDVISHRGPDNEGYYLDDKISLGHRRLSIIDLEGGNQPVFNEDKSICVIFNGEIYNYKELKNDLEKKHTFYTDSDTEVIVHCYEEYGENFVNKLNGMFAIALWDSTDKKLLLARDPMGKKPLYYYWDGNNLFFASEIKAVLETGIRREINIDMLCAYLSFGYTIGANTLFKGIKKLLGGHILTLRDGNLRVVKYWDIREQIANDTEANIIIKLKSLLKKSAEYRMIADVPIGAFLSGGIDSSSVVALSKPYANYEFHTFSMGFETFSELPYAKIVSNYIGTTHHEIIIDSDMVHKEIEKVAWHYDEPMGDPAIINNYFLSKEARKYVKVVIAGEAGDELFGGYKNYRLSILNHYFKVPYLNAAMKWIMDSPMISWDIYSDNLYRYINYLAQPTFEQAHLYTYKILSLNDNEINSITRLHYGAIDKQAIYPENIKDPLNKMLALDCKNMLPERFLMKADKSIMANSVEERLPLMDKNIIEYAFSIPPGYKIKNGVEKYILKMAVKDFLPAEIIKRKKQPFATPLGTWMSKSLLKDRVIQTLDSNELICKYFEHDKINRIIDNVNNGNMQRPEAVWNIFTLGLWYDIYLNNN